MENLLEEYSLHIVAFVFSFLYYAWTYVDNRRLKKMELLSMFIARKNELVGSPRKAEFFYVNSKIYSLIKDLETNFYMELYYKFPFTGEKSDDTFKTFSNAWELEQALARSH